ncbi:MAG: hypothetical protein FWG80_04425 [Alphaproteobacteria bacterium]|nr:hypothetical protein [Alphaproteobacteria bacterium]
MPYRTMDACALSRRSDSEGGRHDGSFKRAVYVMNPSTKLLTFTGTLCHCEPRRQADEAIFYNILCHCEWSKTTKQSFPTGEV